MDIQSLMVTDTDCRSLVFFFLSLFLIIWARVAEPEPAFLTGAGAEKITNFRLRLLVNCKAENYEFKTTLKNLFSSLIQKVVPKVENVNSV